jgi:cob(I)alamin adenosyltransferase
MDKGLIHIYTGDGKGKTTAAVGLAVRAKSRGLKTLFAQFFKENKSGGEISHLDAIGVNTFVFDKIISPLFNPSIDKNLLKDEVKKAFACLKDIFSEEKFDLIILDEFICLIREGLLSEDEVIKFLRDKPDSLELVLTGRGASERLIDVADYVTYMQKIKHPYKNNIKGRKGIEF